MSGFRGIAAMGEVAGVAHPLLKCRRSLASSVQVMDRGVPVDPDLVDESAQRVGLAELLPLALHGRRRVQDLAQAEHHARAGARLTQTYQGLAQLLVHPVGVTVDDEQIRSEGRQNAGQQGAADQAQVLTGDTQALGQVGALGLLDPRQHQPVEAVGKPVLLSRSQPGDDQAGDVAAGEPRQCPGQVMGQSKVAAKVPQPLGVVTVERHP